MAQKYQSSSPDVGSPTLEALYNDLDMFINELSVKTYSDARTETTFSKRCNKDITPLNLDKNVDEERDYEDESPGYSPVLENYTRFSTATENNRPAIPVVNRSSSTCSNTSIPLSAPISPSFLRVGSGGGGGGDYFRQTNKDDYVFTTRSSSLNRTTSSATGKSILSPKMLFSNPTSPLAFETVHEKEFPNQALLSFISSNFINEVARLNQRRKIFCTDEYPLSFNGEEATDIICSFIPAGLGSSSYLDIAQSLMNCKPPLIVPIAYSEKSLRKNKIYNSVNEMYTLVEETLDIDDEIQGVYTPLTRCYSVSCLPGQPNCYSSCCPNKSSSDDQSVKQPTVSIVSSTSHDTAVSRAWSASVAKDILKAMPSHEISRQEAIHELIYTEDDYVRDLKILDQDFAKELLNSQCIEESRKKEFHDKVLNNYQDILAIHDSLYKELRDYQAACQANSRIGLVDKIGDIFLRHIHAFMDVYLKYGPHVVLAEYAAKIESETNMVFKHFIKTKEQLAQCRRLPFRHFIILPVTRLQRYSLLLDAVRKKTPDENPDKIYLGQCIEIIKEIAGEMDRETLVTKNTLRILEINARIRYKPNEQHQLDLTKPGRKLIFEGNMTRKSHLVVETIELHVFLFDHLLLMTKAKKSAIKDGDVEYVISKVPIPMELLHVQEATEGFSIGLRNMSSTYNSSTATSAMLSATSPFGASFPILLQHLGRHGADYMLYAENAATRMEWKENIVQAKAKKELADMDKRIFEIRSLSDTTFAGSNYLSNAHNHGKVTCTVPFVGATGIRMIAVGTQHGIWMGIEGDTNTISHVLSISDVQQIAVLEDHHVFLVLSDKTLYAYALDALVPTDSRKLPVDKPHQKVAQHISFFHSGVCNGRTIVIAMKKRGVDSNFKVLEPICGDLRNPKNSKFFHKSGLFNKMPSWFKSYMEFYIGTESYAIHFLKARVVVVCSRGFEIINLEELHKNRNLPDATNSDFGFIQERGDDLRPLGMYRCREHYLLCYNAFAFMVNVHGGLVRDVPLIEWEGVPQSVAFYYPYVIGFDPRFIEVRHVETGELVQILAGTHMRCLQFINQTLAPVIHGCMAHPFKADFQYVFQLMGTFEPPL
ncbi:hypothetical protein MFLAVUS_002292 [Mucor flavus]|uniref:Uncharacterized protein n=1 Tax=Mucor flavus TaxID=439312 RepID=A0ABP9YPV9_9FUNG